MPVILGCPICEETYSVKPSEVERRKHCSLKCRHRIRYRIEGGCFRCISRAPIGGKRKDGRTLISVHGQRMTLSRFVYQMKYGKIPPHAVVRHYGERHTAAKMGISEGGHGLTEMDQTPQLLQQILGELRRLADRVALLRGCTPLEEIQDTN